MIDQRTKTVFLFASLFLLISAASLSWLLLQINETGGIMREQVKVIADTAARESVYNELENLVDSTKETREKLGKYVLNEDQTINFLSEIESIGREKGLELETTSLQVVEEKEGYFDTLLIRLSMEGGVSSLDSMLEVLETLPYHSEVSKLHFTYGGEGMRPELNLTLSVSLLKV